MVRQMNVLTRLIISTWGALWTYARYIYIVVVRPAITYALSIWYTPRDLKTDNQNIINDLTRIQNKCLRTITGTYKITKIEVLENET